MADFTHRRLGMFTLFLPENDDAVGAWNQLAEATEGTGKVLHHQEQEVINKLREAGYTVAEQKRAADETKIEAIFAELADLEHSLREM